MQEQKVGVNSMLTVIVLFSYSLCLINADINFYFIYRFPKEKKTKARKMAIAHSAGEFPRSLALIAAACGLFVGFFSFIFSCVLEDRAPASGYYTIMLSIVVSIL